uniref:Centrosome-associated FAM110 C-terminal domain-containing protein n=1 Tax=Lutzomyia longipalpis TaxID=7200 RepID=A0A1B0CQK7_LUTLO
MSAAIYRDSPHGTPSHFPQSAPLPPGAASYFSSPASLQHFHQPHPHSFAYGSGQRHAKRKSAVELLAESKPLYVKSDCVLDRDQQLFRGTAPSAMRKCHGVYAMENPFTAHFVPSPPDMLSPSRTLTQQTQVQQSRHGVHQPPRASRRSASAMAINSDLLQTKLRKLLNTSESKEMLSDAAMLNPNLDGKYNPVYGYPLSSKITQEGEPEVVPAHAAQSLSLNIHAMPKESSVFFSSAFLSPQSLPPQPVSDDDDIYRFDDTLILTDDYRAISPPAEYAEEHAMERNAPTPRYYQRSFSHSQAVSSGNYSPSFNINSHKSLPDLNLQIMQTLRMHNFAVIAPGMIRGNRSNKSGSSLNRDSGGSSGHYTHQSEPAPCCNQPLEVVQGEFRRDSGSSTQHSGNSYFAYGIPPLGYDCAMAEKTDEELLNFTTAEVPEAFQDDYDEDRKIDERYFDEVRPSARQTARYFEEKARESAGAYGAADPDISPPGLGVFKRQKCLRLKQRGRTPEDRRPILRSKSDISDKRYRPEMFQLERFFDRLGLNDKSYEELVSTKSATSGTGYSDKDSDQSSVVFFSDVSTVDSTRLPDSTETGQASGPYRSTEPPSIVERNARIIKWLCNCRRVQLT